MTKDDVFNKLLAMYEQAERQINRLINEYNEDLSDYELKKIELIIRQFSKEYEEAEA